MQLPGAAAADPFHSQHPHTISVGKTHITLEDTGKAIEVFTLTLGGETIQLLPFRNWGQLDVHKWRVQGKLPGTPAGLEIAFDHVKVGGESVPVNDPDACRKLEDAFNEWLALEKENLEVARKRTQARPAPAASGLPREAAPQKLHFRVEVDKRSQVHIHVMRGNEALASVGLTAQGFGGLFSQGLMRKPRVLDIGALHDWVELDGELCSFEHGNNDAAKFERLLNEKYLPTETLGLGKDILIFANAASPTGFDIQFPVTLGGVSETKRRTLNDAALELLQEPARCGLLQPGLIIKLSPPTFIFKRKTFDGGEAYLEKTPGNLVRVVADDGRERLIDLSQPVNYARLSVVEMMAVFNHPAVNRHSSAAQANPAPVKAPELPPAAPIALEAPAASRPITVTPQPPPIEVERKLPPNQITPAAPGHPAPAIQADALRPAIQLPTQALDTPPSRPNAWLKETLSKPSIRPDWFAFLIYFKVAEHFGNSREGTFGPSHCWFAAISEVIDIDAPDFVGVFLTQKGWLGFLGHGRVARFHEGVAFVGTRESVLEGIHIDLVAVGIDDQDRVVFIVSEGFAARFGVADSVIAQELLALAKAGACLLSVREALESAHPLRVVWTVPAEQSNPAEPQATESTPPDTEIARE
jgi:hypothetical protein